MLVVPKPHDGDPTGAEYAFEYGVDKTTGGHGWADVWKRGCFGWEYKGPHKDVDKAYAQLQLYRESLQHPTLLIVSDIQTIIIHTNFTNTTKRIKRIPVERLVEPVLMEPLRRQWDEVKQQASRIVEPRRNATTTSAKTRRNKRTTSCEIGPFPWPPGA